MSRRLTPDDPPPPRLRGQPDWTPDVPSKGWPEVLARSCDGRGMRRNSLVATALHLGRLSQGKSSARGIVRAAWFPGARAIRVCRLDRQGEPHVQICHLAGSMVQVSDAKLNCIQNKTETRNLYLARFRSTTNLDQRKCH